MGSRDRTGIDVRRRYRLLLVLAIAGASVALGPQEARAAAGQTTSGTTMLADEQAPVITADPVDTASYYPTNRAFFSYTATGTPPMSVQWQRSANGGSTWSNVSSISSIVGIFEVGTSKAMDGYLFRVTVTNAYGSATSASARLRVNWPPSITAQPTAQNVPLGSAASFTVGADGYDLAYQWQRAPFSLSGSVWSDIPGANAATYTFTTVGADNLASYRVIVSNPWGVVTSTAAGMVVYYPPSITTQPSDAYVQTGATASFTAGATSLTGFTTQWQRSTDAGGTWTDVNGATSTTLTVPAVGPADDGARYRAIFTNHTLTAMTQAATLHVDDVDPVTSHTITSAAAPTFGIYAGPVSVTIRGADAGPIFRLNHSITGPTGTTTNVPTGASSRTLNFSVPGTYTITFTATDQARNVSAPETIVFRIDPRPVVSIAGGTSILEPDVGNRGAFFQVNLSAPLTSDVTFTYYTRDGSATGCTNQQCDYGKTGKATNPQVGVIRAGTTQQTMALLVNSDGIVEPDETFDMVISSVSTNAVLSGHDVAPATIVDVDGLSNGGQPVLMITPRNDVVEGDSGTQKGQVVISLSKPLDQPITVTYATIDLTARAGTDYRAISWTNVVLAPGTISRTVDIAIFGNQLLDGDRELAIVHGPVAAPPGTELIDIQALASIMIIDDDTAPAD